MYLVTASIATNLALPARLNDTTFRILVAT